MNCNMIARIIRSETRFNDSMLILFIKTVLLENQDIHMFTCSIIKKVEHKNPFSR